MQITDEQIAWCALDAGWRDEDAVIAVALALATSGGEVAHGGPSDRSQGAWEVGLWGVNILRYPGLDSFDLTDPVIAARTAWKLWHVSGHQWDFCPAWTGEGYVRFLSRARAAVAVPSRTAPIGDTLPAGAERSAEQTGVEMVADPLTREPLIGDLKPVDLPPHEL